MSISSIARLSFALGAAMLASVGVASAQQSVKVATNNSAANVQQSFVDPKANQPAGYVVDLMNAVAKDAGFQVQFVPMLASDAISAIVSNKVDTAVVPNVSANQAQLDFSSMVYTAGDTLAVAKTNTKEYKSFADLKGEIVGGAPSSYLTALQQQKALFADVKTYNTRDDAIKAVLSGEIKAALISSGITFELKQGLFPDLRLVQSWKSTVTVPNGLAVAKGKNADLLKKINTSMAKLEANGTLQTLRTKWAVWVVQ